MAIDIGNPGERRGDVATALRGYLGDLVSYLPVSADNRQIVAGERLLADLSAGPLTWAMPADPEPGHAVIIVVDGNAATHNLTLDGNGESFAGGSSLIVDVANARLDLVFLGGFWRF